MFEEMMTTTEVAQYLRIHEKQVYKLIRSKKIPATRVTGKWVFPRKLINEWIGSSAVSGLDEAGKKRVPEGWLLASGSKDIVLDMLQSHMGRMYSDFHFFSTGTGSVEGLKALNMGYTDIAWVHLLDSVSGEYNIPFLPIYLPDVRPAVINLYYRDLGLLVASNNPLGIKGIKDLARKNVRFVNRQKGSDTRNFIDYHFVRININSADVQGYDHEVFTHLEVGLSVLSNEADVGIATIAASRLLGLSFIPVAQERFDMILDQHTFFHGGLQALMEVLRSEGFRREAVGLGGYNLKNSGKVLHAP